MESTPQAIGGGSGRHLYRGEDIVCALSKDKGCVNIGLGVATQKICCCEKWNKGCARLGNRGRDLTGEKFGRLVVLKRVEDIRRPNDKPRKRYLCRCDCGNEKIVYAENLTRNLTKSCGCLQREKTSEAHKTHGETDSRLYNIWCGMKRRCNNPYDNAYHCYGARGICVCDDWMQSYEVFRDWALQNGYSDSLSIDRIDYNGNYEPSNCRWTDSVGQANNRSTNLFITYNNETHSAMEWARIYDIPYQRLIQRIHYGWDFEKIITQEPRKINFKQQ